MLAFGLIVAKWLGLAGMVLAGLLRLPYFEGLPLTTHYMAGMVSTFVMAAAQTMTIYYFIGMSKAVILASHKYHLETGYADEARQIKKRVTSRGYLVLLLATCTMIAGGASLFGQIPLWIHWPLGITTILSGIITGRRELGTFRINAAFFDRVADAIHHRPTA